MYRAMRRLLIWLPLVTACGAVTADPDLDPTPDATPTTAPAPLGTLGTARVLSDPCPQGAGALPDTTCELVEVTCPGVAPLVAQVRITPPASGVNLRGTVIAGTGQGGNTFYEANSAPSAVLLRDLSVAGFRVVQRSWLDFWENGPGGLVALSCRYATLLRYVYTEVHHTTDGAFCATANSGGGGEIAYALAYYGADQVLDLALPSGGPPMARVDLGCADSAEWLAHCTSIPPGSTCEPSAMQCAYGPGNFDVIDAPYAPDTHCEDRDATFSQTFYEDSILGPGADLDYPKTRVVQILGDRDCTIAMPQATLWYDAITAEKSLGFAAQTPHNTHTTGPGATAIRDAILDGCTPRH